MPFYAAFLSAVFTKLFDAFATFITKKVAFVAAMITASLALLSAFFFAMKALVFGVLHTTTNQYLLMAFYTFWPSNAEICISAYWTAQLTAFIYRQQKQNLFLLGMYS